jgi:hypothetical protein
MPGFMPGIHVFTTLQIKTWMAPEVGLARLPHNNGAAGRVNPTCGDKPGHDE